MKRVWWFFHGHKLQADKPHDDLLQMMNVDFSTRSTYSIDAYRLSRWEQQLWLLVEVGVDINGSVWITPGLLLNPSINRTRIKSICRELSQSSPFRCYYRDAQYLTAVPGRWIVSWRDVGIGPRQDRAEGSWLTCKTRG